MVLPPPTANLPGTHTSHLEPSFVLTKVPAAQRVQTVAFAAEYRPAVQLLQIMPGPAVNFPGEQSTQESNDALEVFPATHEEQLDDPATLWKNPAKHLLHPKVTAEAACERHKGGNE